MEQQELIKWKEELESKKQDILKRRGMIESRLKRYETRKAVVESVSPPKQHVITVEVYQKVKDYEAELKQFDAENQGALTEIEALLEKI